MTRFVLLVIFLAIACSPAEGAVPYFEQVLSVAPGVLIPQGQGAYFIDPNPVVVGDDDYQNLLAATAQRAKTIELLTASYFSGQSEWSRYLPPELLNQNAQNLLIARKWIDPRRIHFIVGIDYLRGPDGRFYVLEDNLQTVSGLFSAEVALLETIKAAPALQGSLPGPFLPQMQALYKRSLGLGGDAHPFHLSTLHYDLDTAACFDCMAERVAKTQPDIQRLLHQFGISFSTAHPLDRLGIELDSWLGLDLNWGFNSQDPETGGSSRMITRQSGVWLQRQGSKPTQVSVIWPHMELYHLAQFRPDLLEAWRHGHVELTHTPGSGWMENKLLQTYVEQLIPFYLGESALITMPPVVRFYDAHLRFNPAAFYQILDNPNNWFIKKSFGVGGENVVLAGNQLKSPGRWKQMVEDIQSKPTASFAQQQVISSQTENNPRKVDFRVFAIVYDGQVLVSPLILSRSVPLSAEKHNITQNSGADSVLRLTIPRGAVTTCNEFRDPGKAER